MRVRLGKALNIRAMQAPHWQHKCGSPEMLLGGLKMKTF